MQPALKHTKIQESHNLYIFAKHEKEPVFFKIFYKLLKFHLILDVKFQDFIIHEILPPWTPRAMWLNIFRIDTYSRSPVCLFPYAEKLKANLKAATWANVSLRIVY